MDGGVTSSTTETVPEGTEGAELTDADEEAGAEVVLLLPILIFQMEGFLVTGAGGAVVVVVEALAVEADADASTCDVLEVLFSRGLGIAYIDTGSNVFLGLLTDADREDVLDAMLISLARDCEASARVASVAS